LESKDQAVELETEDIVFHDIADKGLPQNYDKKATIFNNIKRNAMKGKARIGGFINEDIKYRVWEHRIERHSNASVILAMDRSGSMTTEKKYIVRSFFWWMTKFIEKKYDNVELVFIAHDIDAKEVEEENFFTISDYGGTMVSSAFRLAKEIIENRFPTNSWNNYVFAFSDGDNWSEDNDRCVQSVKDLIPLCQAIGYGEVQVNDSFYNFNNVSFSWSLLTDIFKGDLELSSNERFMVAKIGKREDIYSALKKFLSNIDNGGKNG
jgi:uncharacterized sporulation protein YeaH/YhbH (DUF444 family)